MIKTDLEKIIEDTANKVVLKLQSARLLKNDTRTAIQKTEDLLRNYKSFCESDKPYTRKFVKEVDRILFDLKDDEYIDVIKCYYIEHMTLEETAERVHCSVRTVCRHKQRLIEILKVKLFSDEVIEELFL